MRKNAGFTLLEFMVVIAIIAAVMAVAVPNLLGRRADAKLKGAVDNLRGDLQMAKSMAVRESTFVVVNFSHDRYEVFVDNGAGVGGIANNGVWDGEERLLRDRILAEGVSINLGSTDFTANRTRFNDRGLPENLGTVVLENLHGEQRQISVNRLGRLAVQ
jgi:type IV fimbrial biogenesis protein FimT